MVLPSSLGALRDAIAAGRLPDRPVKDEIRDNVILKLRRREALFPGLVGYDDTVVPQVANAILSRHNFILLGLRGQAKTRLLRALAELLDEVVPVIPGCQIHDHPLRPICAECRGRVAAEGNDLPVGWLPRERRYVEKLATPDVTIADLIGDVDPIKAARSGRELSDELTMHYGLLPRANRGVFAVNELPDLASKVQVGLFNILQEGDVQIKGYPVRLPLDVLLVFSANPEDYTARGKIITPLKDRIGSEVRTHYPRSRQEAMAITAQEAWLHRAAGRTDPVEVPRFISEIVEEIAFCARADQKVDRRSGVSQRLPITALENVVSNAERRALLHAEGTVVPRVSDIYAALPSVTGKIELEYEGELRGAEEVARELIRGAVARVFDGHMTGHEARDVIDWFERGGTLELSDTTAAETLLDAAASVGGLAQLTATLGAPEGTPDPLRASVVDFILEGLHALKKISRTDAGRLYAEAPARADDRRTIERLMDLEDEDDAPAGGKKKKYLQLGMKYRYSRFIPGLIDDLDFESLLSKLSDLLLSSGFDNPWDPQSEDDRSIDALHDAILEALLNGGVLPDDTLDRLLDGAEGDSRERLEELIQQIISRMTDQGLVSVTGQPSPQQPGGPGAADHQARFEVTDKALDFLGYRALRDLLGSIGRSSAGRHDTRELSTGIEAGGPPRPYEFGDTLNLDAAATLLNGVRRGTARAHGTDGWTLDLEHEDLMVTQGDYQSSCATVLLLDCSHSMVLYGEDRFTPAKRVAMALANLIRHQYPGDALGAVLFHDSAEEVPIKALGRVRVGPYYTNTREGLRLARRILERQRKDMRQIIMITDGKPSAVTRPDGRIYRNAFGLDPFVLRETFAEVAACRRAGIMINTFMLARDHELVAFVRRVARMCRGKAYFTTPYTLGQYVLLDYLANKSRTVH